MKYRLKTSISVLLVGLILMSFGALGASSHYFHFDSARVLRARVLSVTERDVYGEIVRLLTIARAQIAYQRQLVQDGASTDFPTLAKSWFWPMATHPEITFMAMSLDDGSTLRLARAADGSVYVQDWRLDAARKILKVKVYRPEDYPGGVPILVTERSFEDFKKMAWFPAARRARQGNQVWTETYGVLEASGRAGIPGTACIAPIHARDGTHIGLIAVGVDVLAICKYLSQLQVGNQGFAFVAELRDNGPPSVIAHPQSEVIWRKTGSRGREIVATDEIGDVRVRSFMSELPAVIERGDHTTFQPIEFKVAGVGYVGGYQYLKDQKGTDTPEWLICIVIPESEIMENVWGNNWSMAAIGVTILGIALTAGFYLARQIARPLEHVVAETKAIGRMDCEPRPPIPSRVLEISDLGVALEEMKTGVRSFCKYVPADLVRTLVESKQEAILGGTARVLTIFFTDIVGFTAIAEQLAPSQLVEQLGEYLEAMSAQIAASGGTVDKYIGDAIMAFWGAPLANPRHALAACTATLRCQAALQDLHRKWRAAGKALFASCIGLNTGEVVVGNIGSEKRMNYTVIGDAVNVASRLEGLNRYYGTSIIISESTFKEAGAAVVARPLDWISVKGKTQPVLACELLGLAGEVPPVHEQMVKLYSEGLAHYRRQDWRGAIELFERVMHIRPNDVPCQIMIGRCNTYQANAPGDNWDGVYRHAEK